MGSHVVKLPISALAISVATVGCSSSYVPAQSPRVATAWRGGYPSYYRDGKEYPAGWLLGGVEDAVRGNPRAEDEGRAAHHLMVGGLVCGFASLGAITSSAVLASEHPTSGSTSDAAIGLLIGGIAADVAASILFASAYPHAYDAVNIYNDGLRLDTPPAWPALNGPPAGSVPVAVPAPRALPLQASPPAASAPLAPSAPASK